MATMGQRGNGSAPAGASAGKGLSAQVVSVSVFAGDANWTFLSNHGHVLVCLARDPRLRLREAAEQVGITERAVQKIVADLEAADIITRHRDGRRNHYIIHCDRPLRHPLVGRRTVRHLLAAVLTPEQLRQVEQEASRVAAESLSV